MPQTKIANNFKNGLNTVETKSLQPKDSYSYALNAVKEDLTNLSTTLINEKGFTEYLNLGYNYILLGSLYLGREDYILFIKNRETESTFNRILLVENKTSTVKYNTTDLNFQIDKPIKATYRINYKGQRIIYFVDGYNQDRVLNIDTTSTGNVDELALDIKYNPAILVSKETKDNGGILKTGAYEFFASYKSKDGAITPWFMLSANPVYLTDGSVNVTSATEIVALDGSDSGLPTTKSIVLKIKQVDTNFEYLRIAVIQTINSSPNIFYVDEVRIDGASKDYTYTGQENTYPIATLAELLVGQAKYYGSNAITQYNNRLLRANTKATRIDINYQKFANNINVSYYVEEEACGSMLDDGTEGTRAQWWKYSNTTYTDKKSLLRSEVYSLGVAFGLKKEGIETNVYHIPGRVINSITTGVYEDPYSSTPQLGNSTWDTQSVTENGETVPRWKIQDTAAKVNATSGKLGYWESTEEYPDDFDYPITGSSSPGNKIRHHKMPSAALEPIFSTTTSGTTINFFRRHIGLKFDNIELPEDVKDNISYIRFYISSRVSESNKSIVAKGIFVNTALTSINAGSNDLVTTTKYVMPVQPYNDTTDPTNDATYNGSSETTTNTSYYHSFYSPDTLFRKPPVNTNRVLIDNEISGGVYYFNTIADKINIDPFKYNGDGKTLSNANGGYKRDFFYANDNNGRILSGGTNSTGALYNVNIEFRTTYKSISILNKVNKIPANKSRRKVKQAVYVPFNGNLSTEQLGNMDNAYYSPYGPSNVLVELNTAYDQLGFTNITDTSRNFTDNNRANNFNYDYDGKHNKNGTFHQHPVNNALAVYRYGALIRDNNSQYGTINDLVYNPTDLVIASPTINSSNKVTTIVQGLIGDCWIDMFSIKRTKYYSKANYSYFGLPEIHVGYSTFFTESSLNHRLRYAEDIGEKVYYPKLALSGDLKLSMDYGFNKANAQIVESDNYYKENLDFSKESTSKGYVNDTTSQELSKIVDYTTRIIWSEKMLDEEKADNYRISLANNYRDLPKNRGEISHLFIKSQELYSLTRDSLWKLFSSNQTIKSTADDDLTIGSGTFLGIDPIELVSIDGGYAGCSSKFGLVETPHGYVFIDRFKGKFILFSDSMQEITLAGIDTFVKNNFQIEIDSSKNFDIPLSDQGYIVGYEPSLKRILITKLDFDLDSDILDKYVGEFDPSHTYVEGDVYSKSGIYYEFNSKNTAYNTISESSNLADFTNSTKDLPHPIINSVSGGVATVNGDGNILFTPTANYVGSGSINTTLNCNTVTTPITIEDFPYVPDYTANIATNINIGDSVVDVNGEYGSSLVYTITSGNELGIFAINASTGVITIANKDYINATDQILLTVRVTSGSLYDEGIVTVNIEKHLGAIIGVDQSYTIDNTYAVGDTVGTITQATWIDPPENQNIFYTIESQTDATLFELDLSDPANMKIILARPLTTDDAGDRLITLRATSSNNGAVYDDFVLTVDVDAIIYWNTAQQQTYEKNNCSDNYTGTLVTYTVISHTYSSTVSQADADNQALADIAANGQNYANSHGTCLLPATLNYSLEEQVDPQIFVDGNLQIKDSNVLVDDLFFNGQTGTYQIKAGKTFTALAYSNITSSAPNPVQNFVVEKNGVTVFNSSIPHASYDVDPANGLLYTGIPNPGDVYNIRARTYSAAIVNYTITEQATPYADINLVIDIDGINAATSYISSTGSITAANDKPISFRATTTGYTTGNNPTITMVVKKNGTIVFNSTIPSNIATELNYSTTVEEGAIYDVNMYSYADNSGSIYYNYTRTQTFVKNDCTGGGIGSSVSYSQTYFSTVSVGDAQAIANADANYPIAGQAYANENGTCSAPPDQSITCGIPTTFSGGAAFPTIIEVTLGTGTGTVALDYSAYSVPDKFLVYYDGVKVIDTGYRGDSSQQSALTDNLVNVRGLPNETIAGTGSGSLTFVKTTNTSKAYIHVYAPLPGTAWDVRLKCPL